MPTNLVNGALTICVIIGGAARRPLAWRGVVKRNTHAGGIFLTVGILVGFGWGTAAGEPMKGILIGTALGAAAALALWLLDRRR